MSEQTLKIGQVAEKTGLTPKTIRYYEEIELLPPPPRTEGGYRIYSEDDVRRLLFITKARRLGLSLAEAGTVLDLRAQAQRPCRHVLALLDRKLTEVDAVMDDLTTFRDELAGLRDSAVESLEHAPDGAAVCSIIEQGIHHEGELALTWLEGRRLSKARE